MELDALYKEVIMEHYQNPAGRLPISDITCTAHGYNASCGDEYVVNLKLEGDTVADIQVEGHGCAISGAAASMLSSVAVGKTITEVADIIAR